MPRSLELEIRPGTPEDTEAILRLAALSLGEGDIPRERAFWRWKHHENPFGPSPVLLAEADGMPVGLRVFLRWEWSAGGRRFQAVRAVDTATHPDWRGRGIFSTLTRTLVDELEGEGVHFVFNTPNERSRPGYLKMGWQVVGRTSPWIRPLRPVRLLRSFLRRPSRTRDEGNAVRGNGARFPSAERFPGAGELLDRPRFERLVEEVRRNREADRRLTTSLSLEYLGWRYAAIPGFAYRGLLETAGDGAAAVIFRYKGRGALQELRICELLVSPEGGERSARTLLARLGRESGADYLTAMAARRAPERRALARSGFLPAVRMGPVLTVRPLNPVDGVDPRRLADWRFSAGEMELF